MVSVRLKNTGQYLDVDGSITFVKQISDMGDITKANSSYSWQLKFPKTPNNFKIFKGLGVAGSTSRTPYQKIVCEVLYNNQTIESNGNLIITETKGENYKGHVKAGIIDFLQDISNDKISDVIDLSDLNHENTVSNIIDSFTANLPYKYIVAYYNGSPLPDESGITNLNPVGMIPSISIQYLWDAIFNHYGWTYSGNFDLTDSYMTYPNAVAFDEESAFQVLSATRENVYLSYDRDFYVPFESTTVDTDYVTQVNATEFIITETGNYKIEADAFSIAFYSGDIGLFCPYRLEVDGQPVFPFLYANGESPYDLTLTIQAGSRVRLLMVDQLRVAEELPFTYAYTFLFTASMSIKALGVETIDFSQALIKVKVKDFFKEIMVRHALTPFVDVENKAIRFRTLDERLNAPAVDWSSKYVKEDRSEKYVYDSYAQKNIIKHKYNDPNVDWADGVLLVDNANQPDEKELYSSFSYAPEEGLIEFHGSTNPVYYVQNFRMFDVEVEEDADTGELVPNYKQLKDRFYFIKAEQRIDDIYVLGNLAEEFPIALYSEVFADIVDTDYSNMFQLIQDSKIVDVELNLSMVDVAMLNLFKRYYFNQEKAYFILNRLTWKPKELAKAELIKINSDGL